LGWRSSNTASTHWQEAYASIKTARVSRSSRSCSRSWQPTKLLRFRSSTTRRRCRSSNNALPSRGSLGISGRAGFTDLYGWIKTKPQGNLLPGLIPDHARKLVATHNLLSGWPANPSASSTILNWYEMRHREFVQEIGKEAAFLLQVPVSRGEFTGERASIGGGEPANGARVPPRSIGAAPARVRARAVATSLRLNRRRRDSLGHRVQP